MRISHNHASVAPDGSNDYALLKLLRGGVTQFELDPGETSVAVRHRTVDKIWIVTSGYGELWRRDGMRDATAGIERDVTVDIEPGVCVTIPVGTDFQFRTLSHEPLIVIGVTMPPGYRDSARPNPVVKANGTRPWRQVRTSGARTSRLRDEAPACRSLPHLPLR